MEKQIKKTFAILLAVCFVLSLTAASVSANSDEGKGIGNAYGHDEKDRVKENNDVSKITIDGDSISGSYNGNYDGNGNTGDLNGIFNGNVFGDKTKIKIRV